MDTITRSISVLFWLLCTAFMVFCMALIGAITRLTESGLSMVEWKPLIGAVPPLSDAEWHRVFGLYQQTPEFIKVNSWMEVDDFKRIFFWEWLHRLFGRLIGLVYALPLFYFWIRKQIPDGFKPRLLFILLLGAGQGVMGWYMVKSGLVDRPDVSHFRLAAHLGLAFLIMGALIWTALDIARGCKETVSAGLRLHAWLSLYLLGITIIWGAYVAGLDGGMVYNEFPGMGGHFFPPDAAHISPFWANFFQNPVTIQFLHRWLGIATALMIFALHGHAMAKGIKSWEVFALPLSVLCQAGLGITTLLTQVYIPVAVLHQAGALILTGVLISLLRKMS